MEFGESLVGLFEGRLRGQPCVSDSCTYQSTAILALGHKRPLLLDEQGRGVEYLKTVARLKLLRNTPSCMEELVTCIELGSNVFLEMEEGESVVIEEPLQSDQGSTHIRMGEMSICCGSQCLIGLVYYSSNPRLDSFQQSLNVVNFSLSREFLERKFL